MTTFIDRLKAFLDVADRATAKTEEVSAADIWQVIRAPVPDVGSDRGCRQGGRAIAGPLRSSRDCDFSRIAYQPGGPLQRRG